MTDLSVAYGGPTDPLDNLLKTEGFTAGSDKGAKETKGQMKQVDKWTHLVD